MTNLINNLINTRKQELASAAKPAIPSKEKIVTGVNVKSLSKIICEKLEKSDTKKPFQNAIKKPQSTFKLMEKNTSTVPAIDQLPTTIQRSILNYFTPRETAESIHLVQHSWKNLLRNDGCLNLRCMKITDADLAQIIEEYKNAEIVSIDLSYCSNITDKGLKCLPILHHLQQLDLTGCSNITDDGLEYLLHLPLQELGLSGGSSSKITDKMRINLRIFFNLQHHNFLQFGTLARQADDYSSLYKHVFQYINDESTAARILLESLQSAPQSRGMQEFSRRLQEYLEVEALLGSQQGMQLQQHLENEVPLGSQEEMDSL